MKRLEVKENIYNSEEFYNKLLKRLARLGIGSRKDCEELILQSHVRINGKIVNDISYIVSSADEIFIKKKKIINKIPPLKVFIFNKPTKCIVSKKDEKEYKFEEDNKIKLRSDTRISVFDIIGPKYKHLITIGRLDFNTEGLLLFTNCGEYAKDLETPENNVVRVYNVKVFGYLDDKKLNKLRNGVKIAGVVYDKFKVFVNREGEPYSFLTIKITEGKNREIRKVLKYCGLTVVDLKRIQYGDYKLNKISRGEIRQIDKIFFPKNEDKFNPTGKSKHNEHGNKI